MPERWPREDDEPLPFEDYNVALAGDAEFVAMVEQACRRIAGVETYRITAVTGWALETVEPDLVVLAGYMDRVPDDLLELYPVIGFHPSLLPRYRGGSAVKWQLWLGEPDLGATVYRLLPGRMDAGPIVTQERLPHLPGGWSEAVARSLGATGSAAGSLYRTLRDRGVVALTRAVAAYARGTYTETPQDEALATWHPLLQPGQRPEEYRHAREQAQAPGGA